MQQDLTFGEDVRGDHALFLEDKHIMRDGWNLDDEATQFTVDRGALFFRVIIGGEEQHGHGWIEDGKIIQWG